MTETQFFKDKNRLEVICNHVASGGSLVDLCKMWELPYYFVSQWIHSDTERKKRFSVAMQAHSTYLQDKVIRELKWMAFIDIRRAYGQDNQLLPMKDMPDDIAAAIQGVDVFEKFAGGADGGIKLGETKKIKLYSKLDALKMLGENQAMFRQIHQHEVGESLEELILKSKQEDPKSGI